MAAPAEYRIQRSWVSPCRWLGLGMLAAGLACLAAPLLDPELPTRLVSVSGAAALALGLGCLCLGLRPAAYNVELSDEGIRIPAENRWAPWSRLADLAERPILQRVDILDQSGARFASLEYRLEGFAEALARALVGMRVSPPPEDEFRRQISSSAPVLIGTLAGILALGFGLWTWIASGEPRGLALVCAFAGAAAYDALTQIRCVRLRRDGLAIARGLRTRVVAWSEIAGVELCLRPIGKQHQLLDVCLTDRSGGRQHIRPFGSNPFHLHARIAERLAAEGIGS